MFLNVLEGAERCGGILFSNAFLVWGVGAAALSSKGLVFGSLPPS